MQINVTSQIPTLVEHASEIKQRLGDLTPLMQAIGSILEGSTRQRFVDKKSPNGVAWAVLMPATVEAKNGRANILVDSGDLMRSITFHASADSVIVGTDRLYGKYHQTGTKNADGTKRMAMRPFLGISAQDEFDINELIVDFMAGDL